MRTQAPPLLPMLRSKNQAELLTMLFLHPQDEYPLGEIAERLRISVSTLHGEVQRLTVTELISERRVGRTRLLSANLENRLAAPLTQLLLLSFGPAVVVAEEYQGMNGIEKVAIYGSWAARHAGTEGPPPADVDVMVVGAPDREEVYAAADRAQNRLGMEVNPTVRSLRAWEDDSDALVASVRSGDHVVVIDQDVNPE